MNTLEMAVVGSFLNQGNSVDRLRDLLKSNHIDATFFKDNSARRAFERIVSLDTNDTAAIAREVMSAVGVEWAELSIAAAAVDPLTNAQNFRSFAENHRKDLISDAVQRNMLRYRANSTPEFLAAAISEDLKTIINSIPADSEEGYSLAEIADPVPEDENPDALIRGGWFRKGHGVFLISTAGSGKSVITMQICYAWALGRPVFGIAPVRPMRIGIFQTEDDKYELSEFRSSMRRGYAERHGWSKEEIAEAESRIRFYDLKGRMGKEFVKYFHFVQSKQKFDLVIINPLQGVTDFDLGQNSLLNDFLSNGQMSFDGIIKDPNFGCGLLIIHHTNKPPSGPERLNFGRDQFAQYIGAGGQVLNRWGRSFLTLLPTKEPNVFHLVAAKREKRLDWIIPPGVTSSKPLKVIEQEPKESGYLFWHEMAIDKLMAADKKKNKLSPEDLADELVDLMQKDKEKRSFTAGDLRELARVKLGRKDGDDAYAYLVKNTAKLGVTMVKGENNNVRHYSVGTLPL